MTQMAMNLGDDTVRQRRRAPDDRVHEIEVGEDIGAVDAPPARSCAELALEEARVLGAMYQAKMIHDPVSGLTRSEMLSRLYALRAAFGVQVTEVSGVPLAEPFTPPRGWRPGV